MDCEEESQESPERHDSEISLEIPQERDNRADTHNHSLDSSRSSHSESAEASHAQDMARFEKLVPQVARKVAKMQVTHPEVLRVTPAFCAFQRRAAAMRKGFEDDFYGKSQPSEKISTFWSHSWHGGQYKKIVTLILVYNGRAAMFLSFLTAILVMPLLYASGVLPGFDRGLWGHPFTTWSLCSGGLVAAVVVVLWQPRSSIFLDRICISQTDNRMKARAIFSLAGLLKNTDTLLILWDPTWTERLWCLFELAAFLKSRQVRADQVLIVKPILMGPVSITLFLTFIAVALPATTFPLDTTDLVGMFLMPMAGAALLGFVVGYSAVSTVRDYFRSLDVMREQLLAISFDRTRSACCEQQHVSPEGNALICDRKIVKECVRIWFGSQEAFEETVRSQVLDILTRELSEKVFTTTWTLSVTSPIMWAFVDLSMSFLSEFTNNPKTFGARTFDTPGFLLEGLSIWLIIIPSIKDFLILLCRLMRRRPRNQFLEIFKNTAALCLVAFPVLLVIGGFLLSRWVRVGRMVQACTFAGCALLFSACWWLLACALKCLLKRPGW